MYKGVRDQASVIDPTGDRTDVGRGERSEGFKVLRPGLWWGPWRTRLHGCSDHNRSQSPGRLATCPAYRYGRSLDTGRVRAPTGRARQARRRRQSCGCAYMLALGYHAIPSDSHSQVAAPEGGQAYTPAFVMQPWHAHSCSLCRTAGVVHDIGRHRRWAQVLLAGNHVRRIPPWHPSLHHCFVREGGRTQQRQGQCGTMRAQAALAALAENKPAPSAYLSPAGCALMRCPTFDRTASGGRCAPGPTPAMLVHARRPVALGVRHRVAFWLVHWCVGLHPSTWWASTHARARAIASAHHVRHPVCMRGWRFAYGRCAEAERKASGAWLCRVQWLCGMFAIPTTTGALFEALHGNDLWATFIGHLEGSTGG